MNILILDNFFNQNYRYISKIHENLQHYYKKIKLKSLVKKLIEENNERTEIKIISNNEKSFFISTEIKVELLSDFRLNLDAAEFLEIKRKVIEKTKINLINLFNNLINLKTFHIDGIFIGKLIEFNLKTFFNKIFEEFELLKKILQTKNYDLVILFNYNPKFLRFFRLLNLDFKNIAVYQDSILKNINEKSKWFLSKSFFGLLGYSLKLCLIKKPQLNNILVSKTKNNIIFITNSKNQFNSIKKIYKNCKKIKNFNPIHYHDNGFISLRKINKLIRFLFQIKKIWLKKKDELLKKMEYNSLKLDKVIEEFYNYELIFILIISFNNLHLFNQFIKHYPPSLVIITNKIKTEGRLHAKNCKLKKIPTIYIPHSAIPIIDELITKTDIKYITVTGERDKDYFINKGEFINKIIVTGCPNYENFYKGTIQKRIKVRDMFNNRIYKFESNKFTVLLTTNPIDDKSNERIITTVINSLKELNLVNNLIIKLHPRENGIIHKNILRKLKVDPIVVKDYNILELIKSCNLLISRKSTTILEAMIMGTPIILLDTINLGLWETSRYHFLEEELLITVKNQKTLTKKIRDLINNKDLITKYSKDLKELAKEYSFYDEKESPTEKITELFLNLTSKVR